MRPILAPLPITAVLLLPSLAAAHPGHLAEAAGHDHWIALGALAAAFGVLGLAWARGRRAARRRAAKAEGETRA